MKTNSLLTIIFQTLFVLHKGDDLENVYDVYCSYTETDSDQILIKLQKGPEIP